MEQLRGSLNNTQLRAARVRDQRARGCMLRNLWKEIDGRADGQGNIDQVGIANGVCKLAVKFLVDRAACVRFIYNFCSIPSGDVNVRREFAKG